eukprot:CAMPEP_0177719678 /NCGR_PEP_ID=MMETSP0484_2-20121128/16232_1 /TAXON_ID=354590 /ORGANISM="Rhodomonas lens, Strain RHODO" /LENGTH=434 /DNA_ID=CAMNT_0019231913 /DNA_START=21 /DNA_END=1325 /DNA_ORIENTATION=-
MLRSVLAVLSVVACANAYVAPGVFAPLAASRTGAVSQRPGMALRNSVSSAATLRAPVIKSEFVGNTFRVNTEAQLDQALNTIKMSLADGQKPVIIGLAADSGCGKSTFMRRVTACFGGEVKLNDIGRETNTLISDMTTVICLDDYHSNDRAGRKVSGLTALNPKENNFDLMFEQVKAIKEGKSIMKPIYNHVNGTLDEVEEIKPTPIVIFEGLHPFYDERVNELMDFRIYVDITPEVKFNWKVQRDVEERGWTVEQVEEQINQRKPDFDAYIDPQKKKADAIIEVLPTELEKDNKKQLKVNYVQVKGVENFEPSTLFDAGSDIEWIPNKEKLSFSKPGLKLFQKQTEWFGKPAQVIGMDGNFDKLSELVYVEKAFSETGSKFFGEVTQKMVEYDGQPGSSDGTGLFQTICSLKVREIYEKISKVKVPADEKVAA